MQDKKLCKRCGEHKLFAEFAKHKTTKDGLNSHCRECHKAAARKWYESNKEKQSAELKAKYRENPEPQKEASRKRYAENREAILLSQKMRYQSQPEYFIEKTRQWRDKNRDRFREYCRTYTAKWRRNNPEQARVLWSQSAKKNRLQVLAKNAARRARIKSIGGKFTKQDVLQIKSLQRNRCACCATALNRFHIDHIFPLARGGSNDKTNIQLLCPPCNISKSAKHPVDFMQSRGFLC